MMLVSASDTHTLSGEHQRFPWSTSKHWEGETVLYCMLHTLYAFKNKPIRLSLPKHDIQLKVVTNLHIECTCTGRGGEDVSYIKPLLFPPKLQGGLEGGGGGVSLRKLPFSVDVTSCLPSNYHCWIALILPGVCGVEPGNEATVCVEGSLGMRLRCVWSGAWE